MTLVIRCALVPTLPSHIHTLHDIFTLKPQPTLASIMFVNEDALMTVKTGHLHTL